MRYKFLKKLAVAFTAFHLLFSAPAVYAMEPDTIAQTSVSEADIDLIALVTMAEAEGESEYGKRLVIDTILNRMDSSYFPNTIEGVVYQKNQFSSMWDGRVNRCYVDENIVRLVEEELKNRTDYDTIFFQTTDYSRYGQPMFKVGNHYFSCYE